MDIIGRKFVLWHTKMDLKAYKDQMGIYHSGYIVLEEFIVTIVETKKVPNMWGGGFSDGWRALTEMGREFTCNWHSYPDDSITPTYYWDVVKEDDGSLWTPEDAKQAYGHGYPYVRPDGSRAIPEGMQVCSEHDIAYFDECWKCAFNKLKGEKRL